MDVLTEKLQKLIEKTMDSYLDNSHRNPTPDELLKITEAMTNYSKISTIHHLMEER